MLVGCILLSHNISHSITILCEINLWIFMTKIILPYPVRADTGITIQSLRPIKCALWLKTGFTSRTPMQSGISCLFANTRRGTPFKQLLEIILSVNSITLATYNIMLLKKWHWTNVARENTSFSTFSVMCTFKIWKEERKNENFNNKQYLRKL